MSITIVDFCVKTFKFRFLVLAKLSHFEILEFLFQTNDKLTRNKMDF